MVSTMMVVSVPSSLTAMRWSSSSNGQNNPMVTKFRPRYISKLTIQNEFEHTRTHAHNKRLNKQRFKNVVSCIPVRKTPCKQT